MVNTEQQNNTNWYISRFPESLFPCSKQDYIEKVILGKDIAQNSKVLICGICRNVAKVLPQTIARIECLGNYFKDYHVFVYENDSTDNTRDILTQWQTNNNKVKIKFDTLNPPPFTDPKGEDRRKYMAMARNKYLNYARGYNRKNPIDYLIIVDMDLMGGWSYDGVFNSLGQKDEWDVVGSNSVCYEHNGQQWNRLFYDTWALRFFDKQENDFEKGNKIINRGESLIYVASCFGGLAIYKPKFLKEDINYDQFDCDHVTLHSELGKKNYRIALNPNQIVLYNGNLDFEHTKVKTERPKDFVINCDTHGFGDLMTLSWIAEGAKDSGINISLYATGNKKKLLQLLGQNIVDTNQNSLSLNGIFPHDQLWIKKYGYTRIQSWLKYFQIEDVQIKRPQYKLNKLVQNYAEEKCDDNTIVLCPESIRPHREWPSCNWIDLYHLLKNKGYNVLVLCYRGLSFKHLDGYIHDLSWDKIFAVFERSKLVVGCDSAPIHASGITNTKSIALLGPTTKHVFEHLDDVTCLHTNNQVIKCSGCWFYEEYTRNPCDFGCVSLCCISPEKVYKKIIEIARYE